MNNPHAGFRDNRKFVVHQMVVILVDRSRQRVFDGDHRTRGAPGFQAEEQLFEAFTRQNRRVGASQLARGFLAEGAPRALEGDGSGILLLHCELLHSAAPCQRRACASGMPSRSRTRSTLWSTRSMTVCGW